MDRDGHQEDTDTDRDRDWRRLHQRQQVSERQRTLQVIRTAAVYDTDCGRAPEMDRDIDRDGRPGDSQMSRELWEDT